MHEWQKKLKKIIAGQKICLVGFGREGQSTLKLLRQIDFKAEIAILDVKNDPDYLKEIKKYNFIIRSPGIPVKLIKKYSAAKALLTSQTKLFFDLSPAKIIGVTGTKGKSTTASLIAAVLKQKFNVQLVGNIGRPPLDYLEKLTPKSFAVFEISSHQLSDLDKSPEVAVMLNLFPEHLDYYADIRQYAAAKKKITQFQKKSDILIYNASDRRIKRIAFKSRAKRVSFSLDHEAGLDCYVKDGFIYYKNKPVFPVAKSPLLGRFNLANIMPAVIIGKYFRLPNELIIKGISKFKPLPHRLEFVAKAKGVTFINDSLSTIPQSAAQAIDSLSGKIGSVIVGGYDRGVGQSPLAEAVVKNSIPVVMLFPDTGKAIKKLILNAKPKHKPRLIEVDTMAQAVKKAYEYTQVGKICLMSPGAASFNMFKDYQDRGEQFKAAIKKL